MGGPLSTSTRRWYSARVSGDLRISRELSYLLRHGAQRERLSIRPDGYVNVKTLLKHGQIRGLGLDLETLQRIVREDSKTRYNLQQEADAEWYIRANQGHSMAGVLVDLKPIVSATEIPMAVHGTTMAAWRQISQVGLSRMSRNHIHLAQGFVGEVISGMRSSSQILIFVDVARALDAGLKFHLSANGVVLTPGNEHGFLERRFFSDVKHANPKKSKTPIPGWTLR